MLAPVVKLHPHFFLRTLLLLAGDVEVNPGPILGKEWARSAVLCCTGRDYINVLSSNAEL